MRGEEDCHTCLAARFFKVPDAALGDHVKANGRLIEKQHVGTMDERRRQFSAHPLSKRQAPDRRIEELAETEKVIKLLKEVLVDGSIHVIHRRQDIEGVNCGEVPPKLSPLAEDHSDLVG